MIHSHTSLRRSILAFALVLLAATAAPSAPLQPFASDERTLFLCHFDRSLDAGEASGSPVAAGHTALTEEGKGKFGRGAVLRRGLQRSPEGIELPFSALQYEAAGNIDPRQGTLEFWISPTLQPLQTRPFGTLFYLVDCRSGGGFSFLLTDNLKGRRAVQLGEKPGATGKDWTLPATCPDWQPDTWHHLAVVWSGRYRALALDGTLAAEGESPNDGLPLANTLFVGTSIYHTWPAQAVVDELRISDVARYGTRGTAPLAPATPLLGRAPAKPEVGWRNDTPKPGVVKMAAQTRTLSQAAFAGERTPLRAPVTVHEVTLRSEAAEPQQVEVWLDVPFAGKGEWQFWDGRAARKGGAGRALSQEARAASLVGTFPLSCAYGPAGGAAVGLEPSELRSWFAFHAEPGVMRCSTRAVLAAGETETVRLVSFAFPAEFGYRAAVQIYQEAFPQWFRPAPGIDPRVLTGCGTGAFHYIDTPDNPPAPIVSPAELGRRTRNRWEWCYAPYKYGGDMLLRPETWDLYPVTKARKEFTEPTPEAYRKLRQDGFNEMNGWGIAPMFYFINWVDEKMADRFKDSLLAADDVFDHRGIRISSWIHTFTTDVRAHWGGTSLGKHTREEMRVLSGQLPLSGWAHDVAVGGSHYRGEGIWRTPGRAYDARGAYVDEGIGVAQMLDYAHSLRQGAYRQAVVANNTPCAYPIAFRVDNSIYEGVADSALARRTEMERARLMHGSKPRSLYHHNLSLALGSKFDWEGLSREQLRVLLRRLWDHSLLFCLHQGYLPSPDLAFGYRRAAALAPIIAELAAAGWQPVPAMRTEAPLWLARYGRGAGTWLVLLNPLDSEVAATVRVEQEWLSSRQSAFLFAAHDGADTPQLLAGGRTTLSVKVPAYGALILRAAAAVPRAARFEGSVRQRWEAHRGVIAVTPRAPAGLKYLPRSGYSAAGEGEFRSDLFRSSEASLLGFPYLTAAVSLPAGASAPQQWAAWRVQEYFRFWPGGHGGAPPPLGGPSGVGGGRAARPVVRIERAAKPGVRVEAGTPPALVIAAPDDRLAATVEALLDVLDRRYPTAGQWTCHIPNYKSGKVKDEQTTKLLQKAGFPGPALE